jgi:uncharacterized membrane protein
MLHILRRQDVLGGLLLVVFGILGLALGTSLDMGTARRMGPGFFPRILSWLLIAIGGVIGAQGVMASGGETASRVTWRPLLLITIAVVAFQLLIDRLGLLAATASVVALGAFAGRDARPAEVAMLAVSLAVCVAVLFVYVLNLPLPLWGR